MINSNADTTRHSFHAFRILYFGFIALPFIAGIDKFFHVLVNWNMYLSPMISKMIAPDTFMKIVGVIEIVAAIIVFTKPRLGATIVAAWLGGIIINLLTIPGFYDIALRDFGLALGALALMELSKEYRP